MATTTTLREAVGVFHDADALRSAADTLMLNGFDRADLSILASESAINEKLHGAYTRRPTWKTIPECRLWLTSAGIPSPS